MNYQVIAWVLGVTSILLVIVSYVLYLHLESWKTVYKVEKGYAERLSRGCKESEARLAIEKDFVRIFIDQKQATEVLRSLAVTFWTESQKEIRLQCKDFEAIETSLSEMTEAAEQMKLRVLQAKKAFWNSRTEAEARSYQVLPSWKDYLPAGVGPKVAA